ncbi:hypothetical protein [Nocardia ignorata]|uniref:Uncharacterized protein n=1 Tax=Nocardia ignorata TaxID=145285 RepID=A0A4R6NWI4_NOCIG|nr:hypothetical protein [Nocardia ignorata]TDP27621.1 hypothetical protein DFR75_12312 [Nocardia ignorata]
MSYPAPQQPSGYPQQPPMGYPHPQAGFPQQPPTGYPQAPHQGYPPQQAPAGRQQPPIVRSREQKGHSIIKHLFLGMFVAYIPTIYYALSPNHYFHM